METHIGKNLGKIIQKEILSAKESLLISSPGISFFIGKKIFEKAQNGIKTKIITSEDGGSDSQETNKMALKLLNDNKIQQFLDYKIINSDIIELIHPKIYIVDNKCAIVGSANLTKNSFYNYVEFIQIFNNKKDIEIIKNDYNKLWKLF
ncbi:phospholipase D-like domain-containing protein [Nitrosopumilus sp.]|nr:phospholipase D-like domain-containing protein [Nitrosopumilus sp.]